MLGRKQISICFRGWGYRCCRDAFGISRMMRSLYGGRADVASFSHYLFASFSDIFDDSRGGLL